MPLQETSGTASYDGFGGGAPVVNPYIEDVFSTWLYDGNGSTQTITNGIDLSTYGGLVWIKDRNTSYGHYLFDTIRGGNKSISSNSTSAQNTQTNNSVNFLSSGFSVDNVNQFSQNVNLGGGNTYASWTFRKQPKFFDVVTYTGDGTNRTIAHSLGSVPGCIIVKRTDTTANWVVYHRGGDAEAAYFVLNSTANSVVSSTVWNNTAPTSTVFSVGTDATVNANNGTYVAYLFAHDAGGFGLTGADNVITCGTYQGNGSTTGPTVTLGYEPQWLLIKNLGTNNWVLVDNMRGMPVGSNEAVLYPNSTAAEVSLNLLSPTATGFQLTSSDPLVNANSAVINYIYIAIRRGPMKTPTSGTSVFLPASYTGVTGGATVTTNFPVDMIINQRRNGATAHDVVDRLRGGDYYLSTYTTDAEASSAGLMNFQSNTSVKENDYGGNPANTSCSWIFRRAPGFFDEVCYTGTGAFSQDVNHNLGVAPELIIIKSRSNGTYNWAVVNSTNSFHRQLFLNTTDAYPGADTDYVAGVTSSKFTVYASNYLASAVTYVAYLFASCPGVSKVGSYTGNGTTQTINCGFTGGARFVLIKRTDASGDWYVYDTARGMTTLVDPYLLLNSTAAESATLGSVTTVSTGFAVNASILAAINTNGGSYIFLAIS